MARQVTDYLRLLLRLMPRGHIWSKTPGSRIYEFLFAEAEELTRIDNRANVLLNTERDTRTTIELIDEHEVDLGLPDLCFVNGSSYDPVLTLAERQIRAHAKLLTVGQQDKGYFIEIAASFGFTATITEFPITWACGLMKSGDACGDNEVMFNWTLNIEYNQQGADLLQHVYCMANLFKPAHTNLIENTFGPGFSNGFSDGFDAMPIQLINGAFTNGFDLGFPIFTDPINFIIIADGITDSFNSGFSTGFAASQIITADGGAGAQLVSK